MPRANRMGRVSSGLALVALLMTATLVSAAEPGKIPLDYPITATSAVEGEFVLTPPRLWIDKAFTDGVQKQSFIWYAAVMAVPGPQESLVRTLTNKEETIPNSMIVPIRKGQQAKPGDILLTWWQSGSGMMRAIVVEGGTPTQPKVMYLDMDWNNPAGIAQKVDTLKFDSFHKVEQPFDLGTAVAYRDAPGKPYTHGRLVNVTGDMVLVVGFAGRIAAVKKEKCVPLLTVVPGLKAGDIVMIRSSMGSMVKAAVDKVDPAVGRVFATYEFAGKPKTEGVAFGDVILSLP